MDSARIIICGAGIAGISAAYFLTMQQDFSDILLIDDHPPLSLTSDKSTECYRNAWPDSAMVALTNRSIALLEEIAHQTANRIRLNRRGYLYLTGTPSGADKLQLFGEQIASHGAGELRIHHGKADDPHYPPKDQAQLSGADLFLDPQEIQRHFPGLDETIIAGLHVRRAGWFSGQQLGQHLLEQALQNGTSLLQGHLTAVDIQNGRVSSVTVQTSTGDQRIRTEILVNAAGPFVNVIAQMMHQELPVFHERHRKTAIHDSAGAVPRSSPLLIWNDPQLLPWSAEERQFLAEQSDLTYLLDEMPAGAHTRPEGGPDSDSILMLWDYHSQPVELQFPLPEDFIFPEVIMRGLARMLPGMKKYFGKPPRPFIDGGYYTKTRENRPLIGPMHIPGAYVIGALSGFGLMSACAAGELLAAHITGGQLPAYAEEFHPNRYANPAFRHWLKNHSHQGQL